MRNLYTIYFTEDQRVKLELIAKDLGEKTASKTLIALIEYRYLKIKEKETNRLRKRLTKHT